MNEDDAMARAAKTVVVDRESDRTSLRTTLRTASAGEGRDFWSFRKTFRARGNEDVLFQYPAMMVSPMQGALLDVLAEHRRSPMAVFDPTGDQAR